MAQTYQHMRLILGDQLNANHSWFKQDKANTLYVLAELRQETDYVVHHIQKVIGFFAAMQSFASALKNAGFHVLHLTLDDTEQDHTLNDLLTRLCKHYQCQQFAYQRPDEYRVAQQLQELTLPRCDITLCDTEHFILPFDEIKTHFTQGKHLTMEHFYRHMRKQQHILMQGAKPVGGKWNFDEKNRGKLKKQDLPHIPAPLLFETDVTPIQSRIERHKIKTIGKLSTPFMWPLTRSDALSLLHFFCRHLLPNFGRFQDAMTLDSPHSWSLYHSRLSFALNTKMLHPMQVIKAVEEAFYASKGAIDIAQAEGFIRQILGWREYVRGVYWANMPEYATKNSLNATRDLPHYFWNGETKMQCLKQAIRQSLDTAYAHHIQRLMVSGNFCLISGIAPQQVDEWYLGIYIDALEWVELPNTRGMSQFADDAIIATKPYSASGNYINKMSDYCGQCHYQVKEKETEKACPLNSLYWHFMHRHRTRLEANPRIGMVYKNWDRQSQASQDATLQRAEWCLTHIENL